MCTINKINKNNTITQKAITNTKMYSGSEPSCLLHPLPKITTWEFHYIHPEYSRVVLQRLTTQTFLVSKANQEPHLVLQAHQEPHLVLTGSPRTSVGFKGSPTTSDGFKG